MADPTDDYPVGTPVPPPLEALPEVELMAAWKGDPDQPVVSVLCPTFNQVAFLADTLNGMLAQRTTFPFEVVVHDDCSTDGTRELIAAYQDRYPTVLQPILQPENQFSKGRKPLQLALPVCRGRYVATCEGDDYWTDPHKLQRQHDALEARPDCALAGHDYLRAQEGLVERRHVHPPNARRDQPASALQRGTFYYHFATLMFRTGLGPIPDEIGPIRNGDRLLLSWIGNHGGSVYVEGIHPTVYRQHGGGVWASQDARQQHLHHLITWYWLASYQSRVGHDDVAASYYARMARECLRMATRLDDREARQLLQTLLQRWMRSKPALLGPAKAALRLLRR